MYIKEVKFVNTSSSRISPNVRCCTETTTF